MSDKPSCFGLILEHDSIATCLICFCKLDCKEHAKTILLELEKRGTSTEMLKFRRFSNSNLSRSSDILQKGLPKKPAALFRSIVIRGIDIRASMKAGVNPFDLESPLFMKIACDLLLLEGGFTKGNLLNSFERQLENVSIRSSESYVSIAFSVLKAMAVIVESKQGYYALNSEY